MKKITHPLIAIPLISLLTLTITSISVSIYLYTKLNNQSADIETAANDLANERQNNNELAAQNDLLHAKLDEVTNQLQLRQRQIDQLKEELDDEEARLNPVREILSDVASDVARQKKLASIDPELLQKYSRVYFLNENYTPNNLSTIPTEYTIKAEEFHTKALPFLTDLLNEANEDGIKLQIVSAYRSFDRQRQLKDQYLTTYGEGANQFSADQGYSEHQLGTTVDFSTPDLGANFDDFSDTAAYRWLADNAHEFGFVMSYPENNQHYQFEPWHWRFVGTELSRNLKQANKSLYDYSDRELQQYRLNLFD